MANLKSNNIKVFPSARRTGSADPFSRLMSESTLVSLINKLIDVDGFVITQPFSPTGVFEFNIHGYYIRIEHVEDLLAEFTSASSIYAYIQLSENTNPLNNLSYTELVARDDDATQEFTGVNFASTAPSGDNIYSLLILRKIGSTWEVPNETVFNNNSPVNSYRKFSDINTAYFGIDGGMI